MKFTTTASAAAFAALITSAVAVKEERTFAVLHFTNKQLTKGRMDPIVSPGKVSNHVHSVMGASNFGLSSTGEDLVDSNCTNAKVKGDMSNYWYPALYFKDPETGKFEDVELFYTNAYYFFEATNDDIKAFPLGMQMVSGDAMTRVALQDTGDSNFDPDKGPVTAAKWTCPRDGNNYDPPSWPADSDGSMAGIGDSINKGEGIGFPDVTCDGYASPLRADIHFPSCYNPEAGLTNYQENMAWPTDNNGKLDCPKGWIHTPHLFLEVYWDTLAFQGRWDENTGKQPFVLANGDATGYSSHADFMAGWDEDLLQHIIDTCDKGTEGMENCEGLFYGQNDVDCTIESPVDEKVDGTMDSLPGSITLAGWQYGAGDGGSGGDDEPEPTTKPTTPKPTTKPAEEEPPAATTTTKAAEETTEISLPEETEPVTTIAGNPAVTSSDSPVEPPATTTTKAAPTVPTEAPEKPTTTASECKPSIKTVIETVTVTAEAPVATEVATNSTNTISGYKYAGCFKDASDRVLSGEMRPSLGKVSNTNCVAHCKEGGFSLAGTEYGGECYCGNELVGSKEVDDAECDAQCDGDEADICGGSWALSVFSVDGEASLKTSKKRRHAHDHVHDHALRHRSMRH